MDSVFKEQFKENSAPLSGDDKIIQLFENERYDVFAVFKSGRIFKKRAKGHGGAYDNWQEVDIVGEIKSDLKI